jgi:type IV secretory pathway VirJ component
MKAIISIVFLCTGLFLYAQSPLPLSVNNSSNSSKPLIFYISGDGGFNKFSTSFIQTLNKEGFAVLGLDAKDYFWNKKDPAEAAKAIESAIAQYNRKWKCSSVILIGYSFGADVAPFILTHFSADLYARISHLVLLSPSSKTDFEIHILRMLGWGKDAGASVPAEINIITRPVLIIAGDDEKEFPFNSLTLKNKQVVKLPGGHHYDGDVRGLCRLIISRIN